MNIFSIFIGFFILLFIILSIFLGFFIIMSIIISPKVRKLSVKLKNNVHFYLARDKDGTLYLYMGKPFREGDMFLSSTNKGVTILGCNSDLKYYGLNEHDYDSLKWEDDPIEVFINMEN